MNMMTYKEVFPLLKDNKMWPGYGFNLSMIFGSPYKNELESNRKYVIAKGLNPDDGYVKVPEIAWFTNLEIPKRTQPMLLGWKYEKGLEMGLYPKYDNYDAINIDEICQIPRDYAGVMGVPITFMGKYCPEQFEIVAFRKGEDGKDLVFTRERESSTVLSNPCQEKIKWPPQMFVDGQKKFFRILIKAKSNQLI